MVQPDGSKLAQVQQLATQGHLKLSHAVRAMFAGYFRMCCWSLRPVNVNVLLDSGSRVTSVSKALAFTHRQEMNGGPIIEPFQGIARGAWDVVR